jgi:hypothetical protein
MIIESVAAASAILSSINGLIKQANDPNTPNNLSRKRWKCSGAKSRRS